MPKTETVYDSTELQLRSLSEVAGGKLTAEDLAKPEIVQLMVERHVVTLTELRTARNEIA